MNETIVIAGCDTGVVNLSLGDGCTMADVIDVCQEDPRNHGGRVSCITELARGWRRSHTITGRELGAIVSCAAASNAQPHRESNRSIDKVSPRGK